MSGLLNHLKKTSSGCLSLLSNVYNDDFTKKKELNLAKILEQKVNLQLTAVKCESCPETLPNQVSYRMHKDHHQMRKDSLFVCKKCSNQFKSPCSFYRHSCNN